MCRAEGTRCVPCGWPQAVRLGGSGAAAWDRSPRRGKSAPAEWSDWKAAALLAGGRSRPRA
eukprot:6359952-Alexandrium_andersonii.AAC.1